MSDTKTMTAAEYVAQSKAKKNKYGNRKVVVDGEKFDSVREHLGHLALLDRQAKGEIRNLERQVTFNLVINGEKIGSVRPDWTYEEDQGFALRPAFRWRKVADDSKGYQTPDHKTRWKLAKALYPDIEWRLS